jgi:hypothetical protein
MAQTRATDKIYWMYWTAIFIELSMDTMATSKLIGMVSLNICLFNQTTHSLRGLPMLYLPFIPSSLNNEKMVL